MLKFFALTGLFLFYMTGQAPLHQGFIYVTLSDAIYAVPLAKSGEDPTQITGELKKKIDTLVVEQGVQLCDYIAQLGGRNFLETEEIERLALDMFVSNRAQVEVNSARNPQKRSHDVEDYLYYLKQLPYYFVHIDWKKNGEITSYRQIITASQPKDLSRLPRYLALYKVDQTFEGKGKDKNTTYKDFTIKNIEVIVSQKKELGRISWDIKFNHITIEN
jgi:hypothetical protein